MRSQPRDDTQTDDLELQRRNIHLTRRAVKPLGRQLVRVSLELVNILARAARQP